MQNTFIHSIVNSEQGVTRPEIHGEMDPHKTAFTDVDYEFFIGLFNLWITGKTMEY
jgi:hypothetical protein